jgi:uncharacterized protein YndB with AHSA1/START domain
MSEMLNMERVVVTRIIDAPVELVWQAWTEPEHIMRWWGPKDYTSPSCEIDLREGGKYLFCMRAPDYQGGQDSYNTGVFEKIVPFERLEFTQTMADKDGNEIDPVSIGLPPEFPKSTRAVVIFSKIRNDMTELTITQSGWTLSQMYVFAYAGMQQSMDKLTEDLQKR